MASGLALSTPSPPGSVRTPGTPRHGYSDSWEPFSPRKSARISSQQRSTNRTPSPRASLPSTRSSTKPSASFTTPGASPIKKRQPNVDSVRRASTTLTAEGTASAAHSLGIISKRQHKAQAPAASSSSAGMLPTPAKTPRKQPSAKTEAASRAIARTLFATDDMMSTPKKKAKKYTGFTLDSFRAEDIEDDIEIFTDSRDQLPEVDDSVENPFYGDHVVAEPSKRRSKRKPVIVPGEGRQSVEDAVKRTDGVLVVFRGKRIFRKFSESHDADASSQAENEELVDLDTEDQGFRARPMTRSSIKPRLLFPSEPKGKQAATSTVEDEEAPTDIEDDDFHHNTQDTEIASPETPAPAAKGKVETPRAPRFAPASPPSTGRVTRSADKLREGDTPVRKAKVPSPFDGWRRSKSRALPQGQKREGDSLVKSPTSKRPRA
ncbi:hypothetical protein F4802DRAFT_407341 [Xylaria palmicola]|nr:hypothetical protein F4802DRAFT_407341 [Xylaria palmicola]